MGVVAGRASLISAGDGRCVERPDGSRKRGMGSGSGGAQYLFASWLVRAEHDRFDATGEPEPAISASTR